MRTQTPFKIGPDERIRMIRCSLRCLGFGAASAMVLLAVPVAVLVVVAVPDWLRTPAIVGLSWIPVTSFVCSMLAWVNLFRAKTASQGEWNPAGMQIVWGRILSALGVLFATLLSIFFACVLLKVFSA